MLKATYNIWEMVNVQQVRQEVIKVTKYTETQIRPGAVEGTIIVNGQPQMERMDMPGISFESIQALMKCNRQGGNE